VLDLFKKREVHEEASSPQPQVIAVWSPAGQNTAKISLELAKELAGQTGVALIELPCLGIPRLGFTSDLLDREKCTETLLQELEKKGEIDMSRFHVQAGNLAILPANVYATPDYPLLERLSLETLTSFPQKVISSARQHGYTIIIFECQGQLTSPLTFFALKNAQRILLVVKEPEDLAFTLINVKRLVQAFKFPLECFYLMGDLDPLVLAEIAVMKDDEGLVHGRLALLPPHPGQVAEIFCPGLVKAKGRKRSRFPFFGKGAAPARPDSQADVVTELDRPPEQEPPKIRL